jgi:hypothetical protein
MTSLSYTFEYGTVHSVLVQQLCGVFYRFARPLVQWQGGFLSEAVDSPTQLLLERTDSNRSRSFT